MNTESRLEITNLGEQVVHRLGQRLPRKALTPSQKLLYKLKNSKGNPVPLSSLHEQDYEPTGRGKCISALLFKSLIIIHV